MKPVFSLGLGRKKFSLTHNHFDKLMRLVPFLRSFFHEQLNYRQVHRARFTKVAETISQQKKGTLLRPMSLIF